MVLQFLCDVRKFNGYPNEMLSTLCVEPSDDDMGNIVHEVPFDTLHWLFEAQDNCIFGNLLGSADIELFEQLVKLLLLTALCWATVCLTATVHEGFT